MTALAVVSLALSANAASFPCSPSVPGLVSWWAAEGDAADAAGTNAGVLVNGTGFASGEAGQAFSFDGSPKCVTIPYSKGLLASNFTVEAWVQPTAPVTNGLGQSLIIGQAYGGWQLSARSGATGQIVTFQVAGNNGAFRTVVSSNEIPLGQFTHLVGTWDGTTLRLYTNGTLSASKLYVGAGFSSSQYPLYIGGFYIQQGETVTYSDQFFNGLIDEASYYKRVLPASEVLALYIAGAAGKCGVSLAPSIVAGPQSQTVPSGTTILWSVVAAGGSPLQYQWHRDGTNIAGATRSTLQLTNVQAASSGTYDVLVTNSYGGTNSLAATLTVLAAPQITSQPLDQRVSLGSNATFSVTATGTGPLSYQWYFNGTPVTGATAASLAINPVTTNDVGYYRVAVSNEVGGVVSRQALLSLDIPAVCVAPPAGLVSWWAGEESAEDVEASNNGALVNGAGYGEGKVGWAFSFDGNNQCVTVPYSANLVTANFSVEAWVKPLGPVNNGLGQDLIIGQAYGAWQLVARPGGSGLRVALQLGTSPVQFRDLVSATEIPMGEFTHLLGTWDGTTMRLYINGILNTTLVPGLTPNDSQYPIYVGGFYIQQGGSVTYSDQFFNGLIDEPSYYNRALGDGEVAALYNAGSAGKCKTPIAPSIQTEPQSMTVLRGSTVTLNVAASGSGPLRYQWHYDGADIAGATRTSLTLTNVQLASAGTYDVLVTNAYGATNSQGAILRVLAPPQITSQPVDQKVVLGTNVTFNVTATGSEPLTYQWFFNGSPVSGGTTASLAINGVSTNDAGYYRVAVSNEVGGVVSRQALLSLDIPAVCVAPPVGLVSWWAGEENAEDAEANNNGTLVNGASYGEGEVGQAFSFDGNNQCVTVPYSASLVTSNFSVEAWVKPLGPVNNGLGQDLIIGQAYGAWQLVARPGGSGLRVALQLGTSPVQFRDLVSTNEIPMGEFTHLLGTWDGTTMRLYINGILNTTLVPGLTPNDSQYPIYVGGFYIQQGGSVTYSDQFFNGLIDEPSYYDRALADSEALALYNSGSAGKCVTPGAPTIRTQPQSKTVAAGAAVTLNVVAAGNGPLRYQWHHDGADIAGATKAMLVLTNVQTVNAGTYDVLVTNLYGATNSMGATVSVLIAPQITGEPANQTVTAGSNAVFAVTATGDEPLNYQWYFNGTAISGQTSATLELDGVTLSQVGAYRVSVSNAVGVVYSRNALLFLQNNGSCTEAPVGLISWWPGEDASDVVGTNNGTLVNGASFNVGQVGSAFSFNGSNQCVTIPYSTSLVASNFSVEAWVKPLGQVNNGLGQDLIIGQAYGAWQLIARRGDPGLRVGLQLGTSAVDFHPLLSTSEIAIGEFSHVLATWDGATMRLYINGALNASNTPAVSPQDSQYPVYIGGFSVQQGAVYSDQYFKGLIDEPSYYGRALTASEVQSLYNASSAGKCSGGSLPAVTTQPLARMATVDPTVHNPLCHIEMRDDGSVRVTCNGTPEKTYLFQERTNFLGGWIDLGSVKADASGSCEYIDHPPVNEPTRYYRAQLR